MGEVQLFILLGIVMLLIFSIPVYYILLPFVREPRWNREIEAIAGERGFTHRQQAALPDFLGNLNFSILAEHRPGTIWHLLHGFTDGIETTAFYYKYYGQLGTRSSTLWHVTVVAFRKNPSDMPVIFSEKALDYIDPKNLRAFIDKALQDFKQKEKQK